MSTTILPLTLTNVSVSRRGKHLLGPVDLTVSATGLTIILGPNGSGKTTLLRVMHGVERVSKGHVTWSSDAQLARQQQGYVFQTPIMLRRTVAENLRYPLRLINMPKVEIDAAVAHWLSRTGLTERVDVPATRLSGGEKQKLALARALIRKPEVLFLDEPCANLDGASTRDIESLLLDARSAGTRILMATHDLGQARRLATDAIFMLHGAVHEHGPAESFFDAPETSELRAFFNGDIIT